MTTVEVEMSLTGNEWQNHCTVTGPDVPCIFGVDYLERVYFKEPMGYWWVFSVAELMTEEITQLSTLLSASEDPSTVGLQRVKEQKLPVATITVHWRPYHTP